jgi:uncharacterized protein (TIGR02757 family)
MPLSSGTVKELLDGLYDKYNRQEFIANDPILIPHRYSRREDIEISGFFAAHLAWGGRAAIIKAAYSILERMEDAPFDFICNHTDSDLKRFSSFVYRTIQAADLQFFIKALQSIYNHHGSLEQVFKEGISNRCHDTFNAIQHFRSLMLETPHLSRSEKHLANPASGAAAKRTNLFLRWMVRKDDRGVDFGIWKSIRPSLLICPLDIHTGNAARELGLITRKANDRVAAEQLTKILREFDPEDPVKYDYALFGYGKQL